MAVAWRTCIRRRKSPFCLFAVIFLCVVLLIVEFSSSSDDSTRMSGPRNYVQIHGPRQMSDRAKKRVLLWTKAWGEDWISIVSFRDCPVSQCVASSSRADLEQSDAVVFHLSNLDLADMPLTRHSHQSWIFYNMESPCATLAHFRQLEGLFNWTMNYRQEADVFAPYGMPLAFSKEERSKVNQSWTRKSRTKLAVWVASNCHDLSGRKAIVKDLSRYMPVDTFGACGQSKLPEECGRYGDTFCAHLLGNYMFYLAFENAVCRDYVTEKVWYALQRDQVPVVLGGDVEYHRLLPPNSYISVTQFPDIKSLAQYLLHLDAHPEEYNRYLSWKTEYRITDTFQWCSLCAAMHDSSKPSQVYTALQKWTYSDLDTCKCSALRNRIRLWLPFL